MSPVTPVSHNMGHRSWRTLRQVYT